MTRRLGWYVHHQGRGHVHRARAISAHLARRGVEVTILSSLPDEGWAPWVELPRDDLGGRRGADARGLLHHAPTDDPGHRRRLAAIACWVAEAEPAAAVVDVSVEVTVWLRTQGVPVAVMAMPGERTDPVHQLGYGLADRILVPWPTDLYLPDALAPHAERVRCVGGISRFAGRDHATVEDAAAGLPAAEADERPTVLVLGGLGGSAVTADAVDAARAATPGWDWRAIGAEDWVADPWPLLCSADVVVTAAGQGSVADVAAAGVHGPRPTVVIPQERAFGEQRATAAALERAGLAVVAPSWPTPREWPGVLERARALPARWERWRTTGAAERAADALTALVEEQQ